LGIEAMNVTLNVGKPRVAAAEQAVRDALVMGIRILPGETVYVVMPGETDGIAVTADHGGLRATSYPVSHK